MLPWKPLCYIKRKNWRKCFVNFENFFYYILTKFIKIFSSPLDVGAPLKAQPPCRPKISQPSPNWKFLKIASSPAARGLETMFVELNVAFIKFFLNKRGKNLEIYTWNKSRQRECTCKYSQTGLLPVTFSMIDCCQDIADEWWWTWNRCRCRCFPSIRKLSISFDVNSRFSLWEVKS